MELVSSPGLSNGAWKVYYFNIHIMSDRIRIIPSTYEVRSSKRAMDYPTLQLVDPDRDKWSIRWMSMRYTKDKNWIREPSPSSRDEEFYELTQFDFNDAFIILGTLAKQINLK